MAFLTGFLRGSPQRQKAGGARQPRSTRRSRLYRLGIIAALNLLAWSLVAGGAYLFIQVSGLAD